ncbi:hypothetical protein C7271_07250 [filamentous cyanobacterium CCP5]|nr:hypothetical protein C7271_07250 [filamentous cyanobacterium CCP5]
MTNEQLSLFSQEDSQDFFDRKRSWSASKHRLLLKFLQSFCYVLGGGKYPSKNLNYVDGFAGKGKYEKGIGITNFTDQSSFWKRYNANFCDTDGSPLIALKCAKIFKEEGRVELKCHFSEANKKSFSELENNCKSFQDYVPYQLYGPGDFGNFLPKIINGLDGNPTLFFLDTFGVKGVSFDQVKMVNNYLRKHKGEVFLLFHNISVARHAGQSTAAAKNPRTQKAVETYTKNLTDLLGINSEPVWKAKWHELQGQPQEFEKWALSFFKRRVLEETSIGGVTSFEIKESYYDVRPKYSIIVCSNKPDKSFGELLNDFVFRERHSLFFRESYSGLEKFLEGEWQKEINQNAAYIKPYVLDCIQKSNWSTVEETITNTILKVGELGLLDRSHYRKIILGLYDEGFLQARNLGRNGQPTGKTCIKIVS